MENFQEQSYSCIVEIKIPLEKIFRTNLKRERLDEKKCRKRALARDETIFNRSIRWKTRASGTRIPGYLRNPTKYTDRIRSDLFSLPLEILFGRARGG